MGFARGRFRRTPTDLAENARPLRLCAISNRLQAMKATLSEPEIVTRKGKPVSVIIPIKDYEELPGAWKMLTMWLGSSVHAASPSIIVLWKNTSPSAPSDRCKGSVIPQLFQAHAIGYQREFVFESFS